MAVSSGSARARRHGRAAVRLLAVATALVLTANLGHQAFLGAGGSARAPLPSARAGHLAGASHSGAGAGPQRGARKVGAAAGGPETPLLGVDAYALAMQFGLALLPAILIEIVVLKPVQDALEAAGIKNDSREYVTGSNETITVQVPYSVDLWEKHRANPDRYWQVVTTLFSTSTLLQRLQGPLFVLNVVSALVLFYDLYLEPQGWVNLSLPALPFTISSFALGLLITFRVNNATNRYVKARDLWGDMLNISRDLTQQASQWAKREDFVEFAKWVPAFTTSLMCGLRSPKTHDLAQELREAAGSNLSLQGEGAGLSEEEIQLICSRPTGMLAHHYVTHILRTKVKQMGLPLEQRIMMENNITRLINDMGACENIFATPIPVGYTKHTSRFLFLWLFFLPFALSDQLGVGIVLAQQLLSFGLLGVEDIGIQIEQPFDVLPLKKICFKIANEGQIVRANFDLLEEQAAVSKRKALTAA